MILSIIMSPYPIEMTHSVTPEEYKELMEADKVGAKKRLKNKKSSSITKIKMGRGMDSKSTDRGSQFTATKCPWCDRQFSGSNKFCKKIMGLAYREQIGD